MQQTERYPNHASLLLRLVRGSKRFFIASVLFAWLTTLLDLINPRIISFAVDSVIGDAAPDLPALLVPVLNALGGAAAFRAHIGLIGIVIIAVAVMAGLSRYIFRMMNARGQEVLLKSTRDLLYRHILSLPFSWFNQNHTGDIIQRCTSDVDMIRAFLSEQLTALVRMAVQILLSLAFMISISPRMTLYVSLFIPVIVASSYFFHTRIEKSFRKVDETEGELSAVAQENLTGVRVVRAFGREMYERERFEKKNAEYTGLWDYLMRLLSAFWATGDAISGLQMLMVLMVGARSCLSGAISIGNFIAFLSYSAMLMGPVRQLGRVISGMSRAGVSIDRLRYILNSDPEPELPDASEADLSGDIVFDHVTFRYGQEDSPILDDVSFTLKEGKVTGILGSTGSGKSTLMYLLCRLYDLPEGGGTITVGGRDLKTITRASVRSQIGFVLQEPYLFSKTLGENIAITNRDASEEEIRSATRTAALDETVLHFTKGYETFVGERGVTLSGGQKQRTAIAQTILRNTPITILDDSLSAVDAQTDSRIRYELNRRETKSTRVLISHRITTLMQADHIIVLDRGRIVEEGSHDELYARNGLYRRICDMQSPEGAVRAAVPT